MVCVIILSFPIEKLKRDDVNMAEERGDQGEDSEIQWCLGSARE